MGRPKEPGRVRIDIKILPNTLFKIDQQKRKGDRSANSRGKVIDSMFNKKGK